MRYFEERLPIEWQILQFFDSFANNVLSALFYVISEFGAGEIVFGIVIFLYYVLDKNLAKKFAYICATSFVLNGILKTLFMAKRPFQFEGKEELRKLSESMDSATGTSFPSGHSQNAATIYPLIYFNFEKKWIKIVSIVLMVLIPISRLYLGVHFPGDIVIGFAIGFITTIILNKVYDKLNDQKYYYIVSSLILLVTIPTIIVNFNNTNCTDLFKSIGLFIAIATSNKIEEKYINFTNNVSIGRYIIRLALVIIVTLVLKVGLKMIFPSHNIFHLIRYMIIGFAAMLILPLFFSKEAKINA